MWRSRMSTSASIAVVDLHALTTLEDTDKLTEWTREMTLDWLAAGMRPEETIIFVQSHVPQVTELHMIFSMVTPLGWLTRSADLQGEGPPESR